MFRTGEPDHRPEQGRWVLTRTRTMKKLEEKWRGRALDAKVGGDRPPVSPQDVVNALIT